MTEMELAKRRGDVASHMSDLTGRRVEPWEVARVIHGCICILVDRWISLYQLVRPALVRCECTACRRVHCQGPFWPIDKEATWLHI